MRQAFLIFMAAAAECFAVDTVPVLSWSVDCQAPAAFNPAAIVSGETVVFQPQYKLNGRVLTLTNAVAVALQFRLSGETNAPYSLAGSIYNATNGQVRITWPSSNVVAAGAYDYKVLITGDDTANLRAFGQFTVDAGFGSATGVPPPYVSLVTSGTVAAAVAAHDSDSNTVHGGFILVAYQWGTNAWNNATNGLAQISAHLAESWQTVHGGWIKAAYDYGTNALAIAQAEGIFSSWLGTNAYVKAEVDPSWNAVSNVVTAGAAAGATAYGWDNHADFGYLTNETDPSAVSSATWRNSNWFQIAWTESPTNAADSIGYATNLDQIIERQGYNSTKYDRIAQVSEQHDWFDLIFAVAPTNLATVSSNGYLTHLADGVVTAVVSAATFARTNALALRTIGSVITRYWGGVDGTLRKAGYDAVSANVTGAVMDIWTTYEPAATNYARNTNLWLKPAPACLAAAVNGAANMGGILITPKHAVVAAHYTPSAGSVMAWVSTGNVAFVRTVSASKGVVSDIALVQLNEAVPDDIPRAKFIQDYEAYLPTGIYKVPLACGDVHGTPRMQLVSGATADWNNTGAFGIGWWLVDDHPAWRDLFYHYPVSGDSGQPIFITTGTDLIPLFTMHTPCRGPCLHTYLPQIQAAIAAWGDTNTVEYLDVGSYQEF